MRMTLSFLLFVGFNPKIIPTILHVFHHLSQKHRSLIHVQKKWCTHKKKQCETDQNIAIQLLYPIEIRTFNYFYLFNAIHINRSIFWSRNTLFASYRRDVNVETRIFVYFLWMPILGGQPLLGRPQPEKSIFFFLQIEKQKKKNTKKIHPYKNRFVLVNSDTLDPCNAIKSTYV